jgi:hypothetical protein
MLTHVNKQTEQTKRDSENASEAQAEGSPAPGAAVTQAVEYPCGSAVSAAHLPPETPETPQKIPYGDFVAQTTPPPQKRPVAAHVPILDDRTLFRVIRPEAENCPGTVFVPGMTNPIESLYQMFVNMRGMKVPDPDALIVAEHLSDYGKPHNVPLIPADEAFGKYVRILWELILEAEQRGAKNASKTFDFIIHRAAYLFVMANWDEIPHLACRADASNRGSPLFYRMKSFSNRILGIFQEHVRRITFLRK